MKKYPIVIFEGVELAGKSWLMAEVYNELEKINNKSGKILDGCAWLNVDVGVLGSEKGFDYILKKMQILEVLDDRPVLLEKFHLSDIVYNRLYRGEEVGDMYDEIAYEFEEMGIKLILTDVAGDKKLFAKRLTERIKGVPHYTRIAKNVDWYLKAREEYIKEFERSNLDKLRVDLTKIPNEEVVREVLRWIGEE